jgi:hypothetical protein
MMLWIVFGVGVMVGTITGVIVIALCHTASNTRHRMPPNRRYDPLRSPMLAEDTD